VQNLTKSIRRHWEAYKIFFKAFVKSKLVYKYDFIIGSANQVVSISVSVLFVGLLFTQVPSINGWSFYEILFLTGLARLIMNFHGLFFFAPYSLGEHHIVRGRLDRYKVRPLNTLFQVYSSYIQTHAFADIIGSLAIIAYAITNIQYAIITPSNILYAMMIVLSGVMIYASIFLAFATTGFWTGKTEGIFNIFFHLSNFNKYPYGIYSQSVRIFFVTLFPIAFASFFPANFLLNKPGWQTAELLSIIAGPFFYIISYQFWLYGLSKYSSTGS